MSELTAEVRVVIHAHDRPAAHMDHEDLAVMVTGGSDLVLFMRPQDAESWLRSLEARIQEALENSASSANCQHD